MTRRRLFFFVLQAPKGPFLARMGEVLFSGIPTGIFWHSFSTHREANDGSMPALRLGKTWKEDSWLWIKTVELFWLSFCYVVKGLIRNETPAIVGVPARRRSRPTPQEEPGLIAVMPQLTTTV